MVKVYEICFILSNVQRENDFSYSWMKSASSHTTIVNPSMILSFKCLIVTYINNTNIEYVIRIIWSLSWAVLLANKISLFFLCDLRSWMSFSSLPIFVNAALATQLPCKGSGTRGPIFGLLTREGNVLGLLRNRIRANLGDDPSNARPYV